MSDEPWLPVLRADEAIREELAEVDKQETDDDPEATAFIRALSAYLGYSLVNWEYMHEVEQGHAVGLATTFLAGVEAQDKE